MGRGQILLISLVLASIAASGCAGARIITKESTDYITTGLFIKPCKEREDLKKEEAEPKKKKGFFAKLNPANLVKASPEEKREKMEGTVNNCYKADIEAMVEAFLGIQEMDEKNGIPGSTIEEVRKKGFTIYLDETQKTWRPNTRPLYANSALNAVGMPVSPPALTNPAEIKAYTEFMASHYGEEYNERDIRHITDRVCINNRESLDIGDNRTFIIVWRNGHVLKRVITGGAINNPKRESAFLNCPGSFIGDTITGTISGATKVIVPRP